MMEKAERENAPNAAPHQSHPPLTVYVPDTGAVKRFGKIIGHVVWERKTQQYIANMATKNYRFPAGKSLSRAVQKLVDIHQDTVIPEAVWEE